MGQQSRKPELKKNNQRTPEKITPPQRHEDESHEESYDKTVEDSFPASDPPSSIPDPDKEDAA